MSYAICFNLDQSKILLSGNELSKLHHFDFVKIAFLYPPHPPPIFITPPPPPKKKKKKKKKKMFWRGILESACLSVHMSVCPSVYKILLSVKALAGISSHIQ